MPPTRSALALVLLLAAALAAAGCASSDCKAGDDCSGPDNDTGADTVDAAGDATDDDATDGGDDTADSDDAPREDGDAPIDGLDGDDDTGPVTCVPDRDGLVTRAEVPLRPGLDARFRVATDVDPIDLAGTDLGAGRRAWDLTPMFNASEHLELAELRDLDGLWFAEHFPTATYASALGAGTDYLGVFELTDDALLLLGVVSPDESFTTTRLAYDPPVTVLAFPLAADATWTTTSTVSGQLEGVAAFYTETWTYAVDAAGELATPFATFEVLRVSGELERWVGAAFVSRRSTVFLSECFGTVASLASEDYESEVDYTAASEVRRLAP